jgi:hypothetical protein
MDTDKLAEVLAGLDADVAADDVLDLLWLAQRITRSGAGTSPNMARQPAARTAEEADVPGPEDQPDERDQGNASGSAADTPAVGLYLPDTVDKTPGSPGIPAAGIRAPQAPILGDKLALSRSLKLLKRYRQSVHETQVDEVASAQSVAETRIWVPAMRPKPRRWMDLALVVDGYESMDLWRLAAAEFREVLEELGAFRDIRVWSLDWHGGQFSLPRIRSAAGASSDGSSTERSYRSPQELLRPSGDRMILIFSDCINPAWQAKKTRLLLAKWARAGPVAIVQPLPQRLWRHTSVNAVPVRLRAPDAGAPNINFRYEKTRDYAARTGSNNGAHEPAHGSDAAAKGRARQRTPILIPVVELTSTATANWSRLVTAAGTDVVDGAAMVLDPREESAPGSAPQPIVSYSADQLVRRFHRVASPAAMRLAECLAAAPVSVQVMRLIQSAVLGQDDQAAVAEVFLGGLLRKIPAAETHGVAKYDFIPDVRQCLLARLSRDRALDVLVTVANWIGQSLGRVKEFRALIAGEGIAGDALLDPASMPFAMVAAPVLLRVGGSFAVSGHRLREAIDAAGQPEDSQAADVGIEPISAGTDVADNPVGPAIGSGAPANNGSGPRTRDDTPTRTDAASLTAFTAALADLVLPPSRSEDYPLVCPYCYHAFAERSLMFRCEGTPAAGRTACTSATDPVLEREMKISARRLPAFTSASRGPGAQCPHCRGISRLQICPHCHSALPPGFRSTKSRLVALIGSSDAGKTALMTVLIHELEYGVGEQLAASIVAADDLTFERFTDKYEEPLYEEGRLFDRTTTPNVEYVPPLVFRLTLPGDGRRERTQEVLLSFADGAGEDLVESTKVELMARYLMGADAVVVTIDPLQLPAVRERMSGDIALPRLPQDPVDSLGRITRLLVAGAKTDVIDKPVAVVITKLDAIRGLLPEHAALRTEPLADRQFDWPDSARVQVEVEQFLDEYGAQEISRTMHRRYSNWRYFAVSALGSPPTSDNTLTSSDINPHRIADPMLWILSILGMTQRRNR